jgi:hypothetical protein
VVGALGRPDPGGARGTATAWGGGRRRADSHQGGAAGAQDPHRPRLIRLPGDGLGNDSL